MKVKVELCLYCLSLPGQELFLVVIDEEGTMEYSITAPFDECLPQKRGYPIAPPDGQFGGRFFLSCPSSHTVLITY